MAVITSSGFTGGGSLGGGGLVSSSTGGGVAASTGGLGLGSIIGGVGAAFQLIGGLAAAGAEARRLERQAALNSRRATEVLQRNNINNELLFVAADRHQGQQRSQIAASGRAQDATTMLILEETYSLAVDQADRNTRAAEWESDMILEGVNSLLESADDVRTAGTLGALGGLGFNVAKMIDSAPAGEFSGIKKFFGNIGGAVAGGVGLAGQNINTFLRNEFQKEQLKGNILPASVGTPISSPLSRFV